MLTDTKAERAAEGGGSHTTTYSWLMRKLRDGEKKRFCEIVDITPELARDILDQTNSGNRPLRQGIIDKYTKYITDGLWILTPQPISITGTRILNNGQHRLLAIIKADIAIPVTLWFGCERGEFAVEDQGTQRTAADLISIDGRPYFKTLSSCAYLLCQLQDLPIARPTPIHVREMALSLPDAINIATAQAYRSRNVVNQTAAALAYYTIDQQSRNNLRLAGFWERLVDGTNLSEGDPILKLRETLRANTSMGVTSNHPRNIKRAAYIILAWNCWVRNRKNPSMAWGYTSKLPAVN